LLDNGHMEAAEPHLRNAERWIELLAGRAEPPPEMVVVDKTQLASLPAPTTPNRLAMRPPRQSTPGRRSTCCPRTTTCATGR